MLDRRTDDQGWISRFLPNIIGWTLAGVSTFTLVTVKVASLEQTRVDHERRLQLAENEVRELRSQISDMRVDVRESRVLLQQLAQLRGIQP